jgi:hypothetical protein
VFDLRAVVREGKAVKYGPEWGVRLVTGNRDRGLNEARGFGEALKNRREEKRRSKEERESGRGGKKKGMGGHEENSSASNRVGMKNRRHLTHPSTSNGAAARLRAS